MLSELSTLRFAFLVITLTLACSRTEEPPADVNAKPVADRADGDIDPNDPGEPPGDPANVEPRPADDAAVDAAVPDPTPEGADSPAPSEPAANNSPPAADEAKPSVADLLKEVRSKKTSDERALAALSEAEQGGAKPKELAKAAQARGEALYGDPDRAKTFFEWAAEKDPKNPAPTFSLAKQAAMTGDIPNTKLYLQQTHDRGGDKLLQQIDFDPSWEIVKDDPDVRKLLQ